MPFREQDFKSALNRKAWSLLRRGVTSELSWIIYGFLKFGITLESQLAEEVLTKGDIASRILVTKLIYDRNIPLRRLVNGIVNSWDDGVLNSSEWLLAYEILVHGWHNQYHQVQLPRNKDLFEVMLDNQVSFLDQAHRGQVRLPEAFRNRLPAEPAESLDDLSEEMFGGQLADDELERDESDDPVDDASNRDW
ncbi:MAG: hypothetical protein HN341_02590 [Verrucomicrobia bacterium]|jgi:hypothetical protein|nr:hypothetical protein [Verrucomicrobiota bacterium]